MTGKWGGRPARRWTAAVLRAYGTTCHLAFPGICLGTATTGDHLIPRSQSPSLQYVVANGRPACLPCNQHRSDNPLRLPADIDATTRLLGGVR